MNAVRQPILPLLIFVAMVLIVSACSRATDQSSQVNIELAITSFRAGPETITLKLTDARGQPISEARVSLEANMSHAGMAPVFGQALEVERGSYRDKIEFTMAGDWIISVRALLPDGQQVERQFDVKVRSD